MLNMSAYTAHQAPKLLQAALSRSWKPYEKLLTRLSSLDRLPPKPKVWLREPGWIRYTPNEPPQKVEYPLETALVYDIEKLYKISDSPTLATAVSDKAWYGWCSQYICGSPIPKDMIVMNPHNEQKVVIGFNVGYDAVSVLDHYTYTQTSKTKWIDLLAWYVARYSIYITERTKETVEFDKNVDEFFLPDMSHSLNNPYMPFIYGQRSLAALYKRHVGKELKKDVRKLFTSLNKQRVIDDFQASMDYCATDVVATYELFREFYKKVTKKIHPVHLAAQSELINTKLFVNRAKWKTFMEECENKIEEANEEIKMVKTQLSEIHNDPTVIKSKVTSSNFSQKLNVNYNGCPIVKSPNGNDLVVQLPDGTYNTIPDTKDKTFSVLFATHDKFWEQGQFTAADNTTKTVVESTLKTRFWPKGKTSLLEQTYIPVTDTIDCLVPMVRPCYNETWKPHHPFWLTEIPSGSIGEDFAKTFAYPEGYTKVSVELDYDWVKTAVKHQEKASSVSPYLLRSCYDRCKVMLLSHMVVYSPEMFESNDIHGYQLLTTYNKEIAYLVKNADKEKAAACVELIVLLVEKSAKAQMRYKMSPEFIARLKYVEKKCGDLGIDLPDASSSGFWSFINAQGLQSYLKTARASVWKKL